MCNAGKAMLLLAVMATLGLTACNGGASADGVTISGELKNCTADSIRLYQVDGTRMAPIADRKSVV